MEFTPNPVAFTLFGLDIRWYALLICAGMILGSAIAYRRCPQRGIKPDDLLDTLLFSIPIGIVGARAWYVFFNRAYYHTFFDIINTRAGGLAIHGGLVFGIITAYLVCRYKKIGFLNMIDTAIPCVALAQAIGRWGNFFNSEAHGGPTDLPWGIMVDGVKVHPTFLYESLWCLMLFFVLSFIDKRKSFNGQTVCLYAMLYSFERFFVEELRTDSLLIGPKSLVTALQKADYDPTAVDGVLHIGNFLVFPAKTAQVISLLAIIIAAVLFILLRKQKAPVISSDTIDLSTLNPVTSEQAGKASPHPLHDAGEESDAAEHPETQHDEGSAGADASGADAVDSNECSNDERSELPSPEEQDKDAH